VWIHTGSRGLGHQIATDYLDLMRPKMDKFGFELVDRDSVYFPLKRVSHNSTFLQWALRRICMGE